MYKGGRKGRQLQFQWAWGLQVRGEEGLLKSQHSPFYPLLQRFQLMILAFLAEVEGPSILDKTREEETGDSVHYFVKLSDILTPLITVYL